MSSNKIQPRRLGLFDFRWPTGEKPRYGSIPDKRLWKQWFALALYAAPLTRALKRTHLRQHLRWHHQVVFPNIRRNGHYARHHDRRYRHLERVPVALMCLRSWRFYEATRHKRWSALSRRDAVDTEALQDLFDRIFGLGSGSLVPLTRHVYRWCKARECKPRLELTVDLAREVTSPNGWTHPAQLHVEWRDDHFLDAVRAVTGYSPVSAGPQRTLL